MPDSQHQQQITTPGPLLKPDGSLAQIGWARQPLLDCNLEAVRFYAGPLRILQRFRIKRWDYYGLTTPTHYFSITLADLGYAGQAFVYVVDFARQRHHEETLTIPLGRGITLPRNSTAGESRYDNGEVRVAFQAEPEQRRVQVSWPDFGGQQLSADLHFALPPAHESTVIVVPFGDKRFYYNRKINCMPARGSLQVGEQRFAIEPDTCLGNLDWGRGVWDYNSFWVWASASGFLPDGRSLGLNMGFGFGDTSAATENTIILDGRVHKLGEVEFTYDNRDFMRPWQMTAPDGRLQVQFTPFMDRTASTNLLLISSEVHQMFGHYEGVVVSDEGERIPLSGLIGFAEEHQARW